MDDYPYDECEACCCLAECAFHGWDPICGDDHNEKYHGDEDY